MRRPDTDLQARIADAHARLSKMRGSRDLFLTKRNVISGILYDSLQPGEWIGMYDSRVPLEHFREDVEFVYNRRGA